MKVFRLWNFVYFIIVIHSVSCSIDFISSNRYRFFWSKNSHWCHTSPEMTFGSLTYENKNNAEIKWKKIYKKKVENLFLFLHLFPMSNLWRQWQTSGEKNQRLGGGVILVFLPTVNHVRTCTVGSFHKNAQTYVRRATCRI